MNSYFASVEQQDTPAWRGLPVGVCEHLGGIIIAASVEAKKWGITTGTPVWEARKLYPKIILTKTHPDRYRYFTRKFVKLLEEYTDKVELYSIDEAFLDITKVCNIKKKLNSVRGGATGGPPRAQVRARGGEENSRCSGFARASSSRQDPEQSWILVDPYEEAVLIAKEIKSRMKTEVGDWLRVSIGIGWNKLVAKIASDLQKPNGLVVCRPEDREKLYDRLKLTDIPGIAKRQARNLNGLGIRSLRDLRDFPKINLVIKFGIAGLHLWSMGQLEGSWKENFQQDPIKSMGHMYTLPKEYRKPNMLWPVLSKLSDMVTRRLRAANLLASTIGVYTYAVSGENFGGSHRLGYLTNDSKDIFLEGKRILKMYSADMYEPNLISIYTSGLKSLNGQNSLFPKFEKRNKLLSALDIVNSKYGECTLESGVSSLARYAIRDSVGFGRVKELNGYQLKGGGFK